MTTRRRRSTLRTMQRDLYLSSRTVGDVRAAVRGPGYLAKRLVRRKLLRTLFRAFR